MSINFNDLQQTLRRVLDRTAQRNTGAGTEIAPTSRGNGGLTTVPAPANPPAMPTVPGPAGPRGPGYAYTQGYTWALGVNYVVTDIYDNQIVTGHDGTTYGVLAAHTSASGNEPGVGASWQTYWFVFAAKGADGSAGIGVPTGGTVAQVLAKIDSTNYNTHWIDQTGGVAVLDYVAIEMQSL